LGGPDSRPIFPPRRARPEYWPKLGETLTHERCVRKLRRALNSPERWA
jgi:hypothetical protein